MTVEIPLRNRAGEIRAYTVIDDEDEALVMQCRWSLNTSGYAVTRLRKNVWVKLHRLLLGLKPGDGLEGDHINRDRLDNRRSNLRAVSRAANRQNTGSRVNSTSSYRGVSWNTQKRRWMVQLNADGQKRHIGYFLNERDAAEAALVARRQYQPFAVD